VAIAIRAIDRHQLNDSDSLKMPHKPQRKLAHWQVEDLIEIRLYMAANQATDFGNKACPVVLRV
jgi:hypothetical protein